MGAQTRYMLIQEWEHQGNAGLANLDNQQAITSEHAEKQERMNGQAAMYVDQFKAATRAESAFCAQDVADADAEIERIMQQVRAADQHCKTASTKKKNSVERQQLAEKQTVEVGEATVLLQANYEDRLPDLKASSELTETISQEKDDALALAEKYKDSSYGLTDEAAALVKEDERLRKVMEGLRQLAIESEVERRQLFGTFEELKGTIRVYCRVKGSYEGDSGEPAKFTFPDGEDSRVSSGSRKSTSSTNSGVSSENQARRLCQKRTLAITSTRKNATSTGTSEKTHEFEYDRVFGPQASQSDVFEEVSGLVDCAVDGFRVCVLAYGQTGSGKTHTMMGTPDSIKDSHTAAKASSAAAAEASDDDGPSTPTIRPPGVGEGTIPRAVHRVFSRIADLEQDGWSYQVTCYFVEIYNDMIRDLLTNTPNNGHDASSSTNSKHHRIEHIGRVDTVVSNVRVIKVTQPSQIHAILNKAHAARAVASTKLNDRSSRSHCVFTMRIEGINNSINQRSLGNLCLVDLAGSERINDSGVTGAAMSEAININKSLSFLGDCIVSLGSAGHVVWGNCKLTQLLQNYLGGEGSKVLMMVMLSDKEVHTQETVNSLNFAKKVNQTRIGKAVKRVQHNI